MAFDLVIHQTFLKDPGHLQDLDFLNTSDVI